VASSTSGLAISATSGSNIAIHGDSANNRAVEGFSTNSIGVIGDSTSNRGVVGTLGRTSCASQTGNPAYAVGGCGGAVGDGVDGSSAVGYGVVAQSSSGISNAALLVINSSAPSQCCDLMVGLSGTGRVRVARIGGDGHGYFDGGVDTSGADYAESMRTNERAKLRPGDVLVIDPRRGNAVLKSTTASSPLVAGVYSTKPSITAIGTHHITDARKGEVPVALLGVVPTKVTAQNGPIRVGDLLTTSSTPGYAMKASHAVLGTILGKALAPLKSGRGVIQVLVTLR
jgi:hypothetical protein